MNSAHIRWKKGGEAQVITITDDTVTLRSSVPSPPGSRIEGVLFAAEGEVVRFKVHASKKQPDDTYVLDGRPIDLTRALRERICALIAG